MPESSDDSPDVVTRAAAWPASRWLLVLGIPFGVAFALVTPPLQTPDELRHLGRAFAVSEGTLAAAATVEGEPCIEVPRSLLALPERLGKGLQLHAERRQDPARIRRELARPPTLEPRAPQPLPSLYSPLTYLPQAAGVAVARILGLPVVAFVYAGRLANLAAFLALTWLGLRAAPAHRSTVLLVALLPMTLFLAASLSADAGTNALAFAWLGLVWRAASPGAPLSARACVGVALCAAALGLAKPGYLPLAALVLLVPASRFASRRHWSLVVAGWLVAALVPGIAWSGYVASLAPGPLVPGADPPAQLRWIAANPGGFAGVVLGSLAEARRLWLASFIGLLGHADTWLPRWLYTLYAVVLLGVGVADGGERSPLRGVARRALALAVAASSAFGVLALGYVLWNEVGSRYIQGFQGRYFTPVVPLALAALHAPRARELAGTLRLAAAAFAAFALALALSRVWSRFYGAPV